MQLLNQNILALTQSTRSQAYKRLTWFLLSFYMLIIKISIVCIEHYASDIYVRMEMSSS